jgi:hypothetical protein
MFPRNSWTYTRKRTRTRTRTHTERASITINLLNHHQPPTSTSIPIVGAPLKPFGERAKWNESRRWLIGGWAWVGLIAPHYASSACQTQPHTRAMSIIAPAHQDGTSTCETHVPSSPPLMFLLWRPPTIYTSVHRTSKITHPAAPTTQRPRPRP